MKTPPFLISSALLFWGWQTHLLPVALLFVLAIEARWLLKTRWTLSRMEWSHITDLCTLILLSILTVGFFRDKLRIIYDLGRLFPAVFFPLFIAQHYSVSGKVDITALSLIARKQKPHSSRIPPMDVAYPYLLFCLLSASIGNTTDGSYFLGLCLLGTWAASGIRARHFSRTRWLLLIALVGLCGFIAHTGLYHLQQKMIELSAEFFSRENNPLKSITAIGDIGTQKQYDYIIFRVRPENQPPGQPLLLREAAYNAYSSPTWHALQSELRTTSQPLRFLSPLPAAPPPYSIEVITKLRRGKDTLKLPGGTLRVDNLPPATLQTNSLGSAVVKDIQKGLLNYRVQFDPATPSEAPPNELDLRLPNYELDAIHQIIEQLGLRQCSPDQAVSRLKHYFNTEFGYTLNHQGKGNRQTPLAYFLLDRKAGHCELFATATVLILRACDIPARYAVGYVAAEYSPFEKQYIVRQRHGHAWTRVYLNGRWQDLDTTSPNWLDYENDKQSPFQFIADFGSFLSLKLSELRWSETDYLGRIAIALLLLLILMIANRLRKQKRHKRKKAAPQKKTVEVVRPGLDSDFYRLEKELARKGYPRNPGEPLLRWAERIRKAAPNLLSYADLQTIIGHHYQLRFAPQPPTAIPPAIDTLIHSLNKE